MVGANAQFIDWLGGGGVEAAGRAGYRDGLCVRAFSALASHRYSDAYNYYWTAYDEYDSAEAAAHLGLMYEFGMGVSVNRDKARRFYTWASNNGDRLGSANLQRINNKGFMAATDETRQWVITQLCGIHGCSAGSYPAPGSGYSSGSSSSSGRSSTRCRSCGGTGLCTTCNGQGGYWEEVGYLTGTPNKKYITCPVCRGTKHCGVCRGVGSIN
mgnify:FL=1